MPCDWSQSSRRATCQSLLEPSRVEWSLGSSSSLSTYSLLKMPRSRAACESPGHGHVVYPFYRVVYQHHLGVEPECPVERGARAGLAEVLGHERPADVLLDPVLGVQHLGHLGVRAVEEFGLVDIEAVAGRV